MFSKTRSTSVRSQAPRGIPNTVTVPASNGAPVVRDRGRRRAESTAQSAAGGETRVGRFRRKAHRGRLHGYALVAVALVAYLIALAVSNTTHVKVAWVFGSSHVALVWLVLFAAILGWLLGLLTSARFHWRTRAPQRRGGGSS